MPVVVTGASGLVGRSAVAALLRASPQVRAYVRRPGSAQDLRAAGAKVAVGAIEDVDTLTVVMTGAHTVCHLVGGLDPPAGQSYDQHVVGSLRPVLEAAERARVRRFLYLSSPGASPEASNPYLRAKGEAERLLAAADLQWIVIRCTHIYGPGGTWIEALRRRARGRPSVVVGSGGEVLAPLFVADVANVLAAADDRDRGASGVWGLEGPDRVPADELAELLAGRPVRPMHVSPAWAARLSRLGGTGADPSRFEVLAAGGLRDAPDAAVEFGVTRTPLREGLLRTFGEGRAVGPAE